MMPPFRKDMLLLLVGIQGHQQSKLCNPITTIEVIQILSISEFALFFCIADFQYLNSKCVQFTRVPPSWLDLFSNICLPRPERILKVLCSFSSSYVPHPELAGILGTNGGRLNYLGFLLLLDHMSQFFSMLLVISCLQKTCICFFPAFMVYF